MEKIFDKTGLRFVAFVFVMLSISGPFLPRWIDGPSLFGFMNSLVAALVVTMIGLAGILGAAGRSHKGVWLGALIDRRNRFSLSRLQILLWTILAVAALAVALINNAQFTSDVPSLLTAASKAAQRVDGVDQDALLALQNAHSEILDTAKQSSHYIPVLAIDWTLVALMGIATTSFLAAPAALSVKAAQEPNQNEIDALESEDIREGKVLMRISPQDAMLTDLFDGEETGNKATIDIARLQMLLITVLVWVVYLLYIISRFSNNGDGPISDFPVFDSTLLALIAASHAGYITGKVVPHSPGAGVPEIENLMRINRIEMRARNLKSEVQFASEQRGLSVSDRKIAAGLLAQIDDVSSELPKSAAATGSNAIVAAAVLEGRITALEDHAASITSSAYRLSGPDKPTPALIAKVKKALAPIAAQLKQTFAAGKSWTDADETVLLDVLAELEIPRDHLDADRVIAFEEILDTIKTRETAGLPA